MSCQVAAAPMRPVIPPQARRRPNHRLRFLRHPNPSVIPLLQNVKRIEFSSQTLVTKPIRKGFFSVIFNSANGDCQVRQDKSALRVLNLPVHEGEGVPRPISLLEGFVEGQVWKQPSPGTHILSWLRNNGKRVTSEWGDGVNLIGADFVCDSSVMDKIMKTNYARARGWSMLVVKINNIIYIVPDKNFPVSNNEPNQDGALPELKVPNYRHVYREYKYEQLASRQQNGDRGFLSSNGYRDSFYLVNETNIGFHRVLYSYRADCVIDEEQLTQPLELMQFACLRTRPASCGGELRNFLYLSWWIKGILNYNNQIVVGDETASHLTGQFSNHNINTFVTPFQFWSPGVCTKYLDNVFTFIRENVTYDSQPYRLYYDARDAIFLELIDVPVESFIPSWYTEPAARFV